MQTKSDYEHFLEEVRKTTGIEAMKSDDSGLVSVRVDDTYNLNLQFVEAMGKLLCFVEIATLPKDANARVYRDLLVGGLFGRDTAGGYFAVEPETETVVYNYFFDFEKAAADVDEFVAAMEKILQLCDIWAERIRSSLSGGGDEDSVPEGDADGHHPHFSGSMIRA